MHGILNCRRVVLIVLEKGDLDSKRWIGLASRVENIEGPARKGSVVGGRASGAAEERAQIQGSSGFGGGRSGAAEENARIQGGSDFGGGRWVSSFDTGYKETCQRYVGERRPHLTGSAS